jgi:hypothetical protein
MPSAARLKPPPLPPYPIRSKATMAPCLFLIAPEPPLTRVRSSTEASRLHCAASIAISSNRLIVLALGQAPIERLTAARTEHVAPRAAAEPRLPHRLHHRAMLAGHYRVVVRLHLHQSHVVPPGARALLPLTVAPPSSSTVSHRRRCSAQSRPPPLTFSSLPCSRSEHRQPQSKHDRCRVPPCRGRCPGKAASPHRLCVPRRLRMPCVSAWPSACVAWAALQRRPWLTKEESCFHVLYLSIFEV